MFYKRVLYSQRYLVVGLVGLALWLVSGLALNKYSTFVNKAPVCKKLHFKHGYD